MRPTSSPPLVVVAGGSAPVADAEPSDGVHLAVVGDPDVEADDDGAGELLRRAGSSAWTWSRPDELRPRLGEPFVLLRHGLPSGALRDLPCDSVRVRASPETMSPAWWASVRPGVACVLWHHPGGWGTDAEDAGAYRIAAWEAGLAPGVPIEVRAELPAEVAVATDVGTTLATAEPREVGGRPVYRIAPTGWLQLVARWVERHGEAGLERARALLQRKADRRTP